MSDDTQEMLKRILAAKVLILSHVIAIEDRQKGRGEFYRDGHGRDAEQRALDLILTMQDRLLHELETRVPIDEF